MSINVLESDRARTILVTGGAGYVGSTLIGPLLKYNDRVVVVDNLSFGGEALITFWHHPNFKFIKADIASAADMRRLFEHYKFDVVFHLAAIVGDPACAQQPDLARKVNWDASMNLLELSLVHGVERFIFASTCSNYGKMTDAEGYVDETSPLAPVSLYAELKVQFENVILNEVKKQENFAPVLLRFATVYGTSPRMRFDLTVNEFTKELAMGRELTVFGEQFWRPYCHVYDFARAMLVVLNTKPSRVAYEVFNVGDTMENYQKKRIVEEIQKFIPDARVRYVQKDEDPRDYRVSFNKINEKLGFKISKRLPVGIRAIKYLIDNKVILNPDDAKYRNSEMSLV